MSTRRFNLAGLAVCAALFAVAGCGDDDEDTEGGAAGDTASEPQAFQISAAGNGKNLKFTAPESIEGGLTRITFENGTKQPLGMQLIRVEGDQTIEEVAKAGSAWGDKGKALAPWMRFEGGTPRALPGQTTTSIQVLAPGKYYAYDIESNVAAPFEVTGAGGGSLPEPAGGTITAEDYSFEATGLKTGKQQVLIDNAGKEPHFLVALPIRPGKTLADVKQFIKTEKGEDPIIEKDGVDTPVLEGGGKQVAELTLKRKGKYALMCFVPDRKGGPPHAVKGMVSEGTVE